MDESEKETKADGVLSGKEEIRRRRKRKRMRENRRKRRMKRIRKLGKEEF